jgi:hypothetical protein
MESLLTLSLTVGRQTYYLQLLHVTGWGLVTKLITIQPRWGQQYGDESVGSLVTIRWSDVYSGKVKWFNGHKFV